LDLSNFGSSIFVPSNFILKKSVISEWIEIKIHILIYFSEYFSFA